MVGDSTLAVQIQAGKADTEPRRRDTANSSMAPVSSGNHAIVGLGPLDRRLCVAGFRRVCRLQMPRIVCGLKSPRNGDVQLLPT